MALSNSLSPQACGSGCWALGPLLQGLYLQGQTFALGNFERPQGTAHSLVTMQDGPKGAAACSGFARLVQRAHAAPSLELEHGLAWLGGGAFGWRDPQGREETLSPIWPSAGSLGRSWVISRVDDLLKTVRNWALNST